MVILSYQDISSDQNNSIDVMLPQQKTIKNGVMPVFFHSVLILQSLLAYAFLF